VEATDTGVEGDRAERIDARHGPAHDGGALGRRRVVRLEHKAGEPELGETVRKVDVVDVALREVGLDVDVQVIGATDELAGATRRLQAVLPLRGRAASP